MRRIESAGIVCLLVTGGFLGVAPTSSEVSSAYVPRPPILIVGNSGFTAANGVTGGSGTAVDPYVIEGWEINASSSRGIEIRNTDAHFIIRDCSVYWGYRDYEGIFLWDVRNGLIENVSAEFNTDGIAVAMSTNITITRNNASLNYHNGISIGRQSTNVALTNNTAVSNHRDGIALDTSTNIILAGNVMVSNSIDMFGFNLDEWNTHTIDTTNSVNGKPVYYWKDRVGGTVPSGAGEVILANCTGVRVENQNISGGSQAIVLGYSNANTVSGNNASSNNVDGIYLAFSDGNTVEDNIASKNEDGIKVAFSEGNLLANNTASGNFDGLELIQLSKGNRAVNNTFFSNRVYGIIHAGSSGDIIESNTIHWNRYDGIYLERSSGVLIANNTIFSNVQNGIYLKETMGSIVANNTASLNGQSGIYIESYMGNTIANNTVSWNELQGIRIKSSTSNAIHHNDIINNTAQAYDDKGPENTWDDGYPSGGNFWSDYVGVDAFSGPNQNLPGSDGIGDTPYVIDLNSTDRYPLMTPTTAIDMVPPTVSITSPTDGQVFTSPPVTVVGTASDAGGSGLNRVEVRVNGGPWRVATGLGSWSIAMDLTPGFNIIDARSLDNDWNPSVIDFVNVTYSNPPTAAFTVSPTSGSIATTFAVDASSSSDLEDPPASLQVRWDWEDDGMWDTTFTTTKTAQHQYATPGTFSIRMDVRDTVGFMDTAVRQVWVNNTAPIASFIITPFSGNLTTTFSTDASSSSDLEDPPSALEVRWDWEDDAAWDTSWSTTKTANNQYTSLGVYTIRLEVRDSGGLTNQAIRQVWVNNTAPIASFIAVPDSGDVSTTFAVDASLSSDLEDPTSALEVRWDWEDDGMWDTTFTTTKTAQHQYSTPGTYSIRLEVRDTVGFVDSAIKQVWVNNTAPVAAFAVLPGEGNMTTAFLFDSSSCSDLEDSVAVLEVRWDWEDDATWDTSWSTTKTANHQYTSLGVYTIRLEVRDSGGLTNQAIKQVWVNNTAPMASFIITPVSGNVTTTFSTDASSSSDLEDPPSALEVRWDWEDDSIWETSWSAAKGAQHQYATPGTYTIRMEIRDTAGATVSTTRQIWVNNTPPKAAFTISPPEGNITTTFTVDATSSSDLEDATPSLQTRWDWEDDGLWDSSWSTTQNAQHQYLTVGVYAIRLGVRDSGWLICETTRQVWVNNTAPKASFTILPASGDAATNFTVDASLSVDLEDAPMQLEVRWDWEDDGTWDTNWTTTKTANHRYATPGPYVIRLEVRDTGRLTNGTTMTVLVIAPTEIPSEFPWWILLILIIILILIILILLWRKKRNKAKSPQKIVEPSEDVSPPTDVPPSEENDRG